jgi:glycine/D-amino acid oxidase-like deaminating enzyme
VIKVIVIGAGVLGASSAYRLAQAGADVTVLEAGRAGGGTSGTSFAWTNSHRKRPIAYHKLNVAGMAAHAALKEEFGATPWWHGGGSIEWVEAGEIDELRENVAQLQAWDYKAEWIRPSDLAELEPEIDLATVGASPVAFFADEGWLDPVPYLYAMLAAARARHGAKVVLGARVADVTMRADRVTGVRLADGTLHEADMVVNCAGRWANEAVREAGLHLPLAPTVGLLVLTPPVATGLRHVVHTPVVNGRPDGAGRLMLHWDKIDPTVPAEALATPDLPQACDIMDRARRLLPAMGNVSAEAARIGIRPMPLDGLTAIGPAPRVDGYYVAVTHSGVTMSPFLGAVVADEVVHGRIRPEVADFRPARFFN